MKTNSSIVLTIGLAIGFCFSAPIEAQQKTGAQLAGVKCPVMTSRDVDPDRSLEFAGGKVYFCCENCLAKFQASPDEYRKAARKQLRATGQASSNKPTEKRADGKGKGKTKIDLDELKSELAAAIKAGKLTEQQAIEKYKAVVDGKSVKGPSKGKSGQGKLGQKTMSGFVAKLAELVEQGKLTKQEATELYNLVMNDDEDVDKSPSSKKGQSKAGPRGADYKVSSLAAQKELSKHLPTTSTGDDREGPVACGFFGWAAAATHRFMDNSHQGEPRLIEGLSFRLDHRDHDTIGRSWDNVTIKIAHGDWSTIKYNSSRDYELVDKESVVFDKQWSFPTLKGYPALEPAEWGGPQNCLNFRFDKPFMYNGKDAIFVEFVFRGGKTEDGRHWEGDLPYGFEYYLDSMPESGGWRVAEEPTGIYRSPRVEAVVSYTAGGQSVWTSSPKGMPYLKWGFRESPR